MMTTLMTTNLMATMMATRTARTTMTMMTMSGQLLILMVGFWLARLGGCRKENKAAQTSIELFP